MAQLGSKKTIRGPDLQFSILQQNMCLGKRKSSPKMKMKSPREEDALQRAFRAETQGTTPLLSFSGNPAFCITINFATFNIFFSISYQFPRFISLVDPSNSVRIITTTKPRNPGSELARLSRTFRNGSAVIRVTQSEV
jgi:hypothetical protein